MNIGLFTDTYFPQISGVATSIKTLKNALEKQGHNVFIFTTTDDLAQPLLTKEAGNAIRLMTIHGSKGLEFPIVFYVGLEHRFQMRDLSGNYVINSDKVGLTLRESHYRADSLVKAIGNVEKRRQLLEEEARILYVGLTRAKQKLILVADIPNFDKSVQTWDRELNHDGDLPLADKLAAKSPLNFVGPALRFNQHVSQKITDITSAVDQSQNILYINYDNQESPTAVEQLKEPKKGEDLQLLGKTAKRLYHFDYPFKDASKTTAYQAVSEIKKAFNDRSISQHG